MTEPGQRWDPETDRLLLLGSLGASKDAPPAVNGSLKPEPIELRAGTTYRLRFMHISPDDRKLVRLTIGDQPVRRPLFDRSAEDHVLWRAVAKDGADLPAALVRTEPAILLIHVGETYDFEWTPEHPGDFTLPITTSGLRFPPGFGRPDPPPHEMEIAVRVR